MIENTCPVPYTALYLTGNVAESHNLIAIVDEWHVPWITQWRWHSVSSKRPTNECKWKWYARRTTKIGGRSGRTINIWLHKEICLKAHGLPPSPRHIMVDHKNGNSLDCREDNLRWATPQMNATNYHGFFALQLKMAFVHNKPERVILPRHMVGGSRGNGDTAGSMAVVLGAGERPGDQPVRSGSVEVDGCPF